MRVRCSCFVVSIDYIMKISDLFILLPNGNFSPKQDLKLGGVFMSKGSTMGGNVTLNGINLRASWNKKVKTTQIDGVTLIGEVTD